MKRIERVVVDECIGQTSALPEQLRSRLGDRPIKFVFLATEHPGIPDVEILDKLLDARTALLTQDRVLHNLAIGRGFQSFVHTLESGLTDRRLAHVSAQDKYLPVSSLDSNELVSIDPHAMATALFRGQGETVRGQICAPRPKAQGRCFARRGVDCL